MNTTLLTCALIAVPALLAAQNECDSLQILSIEYAPFTDTALQVTVLDESSIFFGYPRFILVNDAGDTLAREGFNFFGIVSDVPSVHRMDLEQGMELPGTPFTGTLVLNYFTGDGDQQCTFPMDEVPLCPQSECSMMQVYVYNSSTDLVTTSFDWEITNAENEFVGSGVLSIDAADQQQALEDICLPAGEYTLHIEQNGANGISFIAGVTQGGFSTNGPDDIIAPGGSIELPFSYYSGCAALGMGVNDELPSSPQLLIDQRSLTITSNNEKPLGPMIIFDTTGRRVKQFTVGSTSATIDLGELASGIHIIRSVDGSAWPAQRFLLP